MDEPRLLFIYKKSMPFVEEDRALLQEHYDVRTFCFDAAQTKTILGLMTLFLRQLIWLLRELPEADVMYGWFGDQHLFLPALLGRVHGVPLAVPIAGFDAIHLPELNYGVYDSVWRAPLVKAVYRLSEKLLPVSETLIYSENRYSSYPDIRPNGVKAHVPTVTTPYEVIPFGYDAEEWPMGPDERGPVVCTVGFMPDDRTFRRKGGDLFIEAARRMPEVHFEIVGVPAERHGPIERAYELPPNVQLRTPVPRTDLSDVYGHASVYAQLSRAEGQPNVLSESMCCGCIPVGSAVFGIPETIGDTGYVVETPELETIVTTIETALQEGTPERRHQARRRIVERFSLDQRRQRILKALRPLHDRQEE